MPKYMLLRHGGDKRPVAYCQVPVPHAFKSMVENFGDPANCQVKVVDCDGDRHTLAVHFKDNSGWRAPKIKREVKS